MIRIIVTVKDGFDPFDWIGLIDKDMFMSMNIEHVDDPAAPATKRREYKGRRARKVGESAAGLIGNKLPLNVVIKREQIVNLLTDNGYSANSASGAVYALVEHGFAERGQGTSIRLTNRPPEAYSFRHPKAPATA